MRPVVPVPLPPLLVPVRDRLGRPPREGEGLLLHDVSLTDLIRLAAAARHPLAVDLDAVEGLRPDLAAAAFVARRLGARVLITRRPALAAGAVELGLLGLLRVFCLDSTGLEQSLRGHPGPPVGTAVSPGLVLTHLAPGRRRALPRPVLAYGLIRRAHEAEAALAAGADAVALEP